VGLEVAADQLMALAGYSPIPDVAPEEVWPERAR
jgi:hypothetical protein